MNINIICKNLVSGKENIEEYFQNNNNILEQIYFIPKKVDKTKFNVKDDSFLSHINKTIDYYKTIDIETVIRKYINLFEEELNFKIENEKIYVIIGYNTTTIYSCMYNNQKVTVLLLESTKDLDYLKMLLAHEITHWIRAKKIDHDIFETCIGERFVTEGIACNYSKKIVPNKKEEYYCIVPTDTVNWCKTNIAFLEKETKNNLNTNYKMSDFFYMFANIEYPTRTGYVYGYLKVLEYLHKNKLEVKDIINIEWKKIFEQ